MRSLRGLAEFIVRNGAIPAPRISLTESKHVLTHRGPNTYKDSLSHLHRTMLPNMAQLQRTAHRQASGLLDRKLSSLEPRFADKVRIISSDASNEDKLRAVNSLKSDLRSAYHDAYALGVGGSSSGLHPTGDLRSVEDKRWVDSAWTHEMRFFNRFLGQVLDGELNNVQINQRVGMYMDTVRGIYDAGRVNGTHPDSLIYWIYAPEAHHCRSCLYLRDHSPYTKNTLPTTPCAGATECLSNCKCHLRIQLSEPDVVRQVEATSLSRASHLTFLNQTKRRARGRQESVSHFLGRSPLN